MDPKLMLLFALIGTIVGLSQLGGEGERQLRRLRVGRRWRQMIRRT